MAFLQNKNVQGDEIIFNDLADEIIDFPPLQGYLTISNALQWRLQYSRVISLKTRYKEFRNMNGKRELGDYQTPADFASRICRYLKDERKIAPNVVIEPTCGIGSFISGSLMFDADNYYGIEINPNYCDVCAHEIRDSRVHIINANVFDFDFRASSSAL